MKRTPMPPRQTPLRPRSKGRGKVEYQDAKAREICKAHWGKYCLFQMVDCNHYGQLEVMHIFPKSTHPHIRYEKLNLLPGCTGVHRYFHSHPKEAMELMLAKLTPVERTELERLASRRR